MSDTHLIIFNRAPAVTADGWIHIVPRGELGNREAGLVQVLDEASMDAILRNIAADRARLGDKWPGIYAGREHFIYNAEQDSEALAWFKDFEKRADGIWAKDDGLTDLGREAVANRRYKFTSFVADRRDTEKLEGNKVRILKIDTVGFTNQANGKELLTPITNRKNFATADAAAGNQNKNKGQHMKSVCTLLGLSAEADESSVHAEVTKLINRATKAEAEVAPLKNRATALEADNSALLGEQCEALLDAHGVKDAKQRPHLLKLISPLKNREERVTALIELGHKPAAAGKSGAVILNRAEGGTPVVKADPADERAQADKAESEVKGYMLTNRCSYSEARNAVRLLKPELFGITTGN